ncbi:MAG: aminoglycoside 6-adenylyltransferase [Ruminiclostridium sp.]|nr:aminoglycoside 6-adenylyltransferase [Ruminiclostridium sp.]
MSTDRYADIKSGICGAAERDEDIRAVVVIGSSTRDNVPADEYSDLDLFIVTRAPESWFSGEYPNRFGEIAVSFIEPTLGGGRERRSIYDGYRDVDMIVLTPEQFAAALGEGVAGWVMNRGYRFLCDKDNYAAEAARYVSPAVSRAPMPEEEFVNTVEDFFFHNIWTYKKLLRGELWAAKMCADGYLKNRLLKMIEEYSAEESGADVWHDGRFLDRWADASVREELKGCFARYDADDCRKALLATHALFARLARGIAENREFCYPEKAEMCAAEFLKRPLALENEREKKSF